MTDPDAIDIASNRKDVKYPYPVLARRVLWGLTSPLFKFSPRRSFWLRNFMLRFFGARIGKDVNIYNSAIIYMPWNLEVGDWSSIGEQTLIYNLGLVSIGEKVTISHRAHLCAGTHDHSEPGMPLLRPPITIGDGAWICTDAFVGPGVSIGEGAVVGARAVAVKDAAPWAIVAGNPARMIGRRTLKAPGDKESL